MDEIKMMVIEDGTYKPSSPEKPQRKFFIETDAHRWDVYVSRFEIRETGTPVYHALTDEGHSAYGLTVNEAVNDISEIMRRKLAGARIKKVSFDDVRHYLDPIMAARESIKIAEAFSRKPLLARLFGFDFK